MTDTETKPKRAAFSDRDVLLMGQLHAKGGIAAVLDDGGLDDRYGKFVLESKMKSLGLIGMSADETKQVHEIAAMIAKMENAPLVARSLVESLREHGVLPRSGRKVAAA